MLTAARCLGLLVLLKAVDVGSRGPGALPAAGWLVALALFAGAGLALVLGDGRLRWAALLAGTAAVCVDAPIELRRQHLLLVGAVALGAVVARDPPERLLLWRSQLSVLYGAAALAKLNESFLGGDVLAVAAGAGPLGGSPVVVDPRVLVPAAALTVVVEAALAVTPWLPALRRPGTGLAVALHGAALVLLTTSPAVGLRLLFFGGVSVTLHACSAGLLRPGRRSSPRRSASRWRRGPCGVPAGWPGPVRRAGP